MKTASQIRQTFLQFFEARGHRIVPSSSLVPQNDPTLMFTNAGMVQFKDIFVGKETRSYTRAVSSQKCLRVSGKHNDLDEVGRTARHHTFFEMLGNFSFGDYFKAEAIEFAYDLLTKELGIDPSRLIYTVFGGDPALPTAAPDDEARALWRKIAGVSDDRVQGLGKKDNFWQMGDTGPCGPCSEIHFFQGDNLPCKEESQGRSCKGVACDCDRWLEIWNLVFMQFEQKEDKSLILLPAPSIDTGAGLERVTAVMNGQLSNYHTDLFWPLLEAAGDLAKKRYNPATELWSSDDNVSLRVIADHARTSAFCMADGVFPSNTGREYVLRRIMRRAISHGVLLGIDDVFMDKILDVVISEMGSQYPELRERRATILSQARREEESFRNTIRRSLGELDRFYGDLDNPSIWEKDDQGTRILSGSAAFRLRDTYGCPMELMSAVGKRRGFEIDEKGFEARLEEQKELSRKSQKLGGKEVGEAYKELVQEIGATEFLGYQNDETETEIAAILLRQQDGDKLTLVRVSEAFEGQEVEIIALKTPFYGEAGGQVGDTGSIQGKAFSIEVEDTRKPGGSLIVHQGKIAHGTVRVGASAHFAIDTARRRKIRAAHSATHLLHHALREVLGGHVTQMGSKVEPDRLRFDFSHNQAPSQDELRSIEERVNRMVRENKGANTRLLSFDEARQEGAMAIFEEKYGDVVRAIRIHDSFELCGGTHVSASGDIGLFKFCGSSPLGAGIRRVEALTGQAALDFVQKEEELLQRTASLLRGSSDELLERVTLLLEENAKKQRDIDILRDKLSTGEVDALLRDAKDYGGVKVLAARAPFGDPKLLREFADKVRDKLGSGVFLLAAVETGKVSLLCSVSKDLIGRFKAGDLIRDAAQEVGGKGGGKPELAQAGGTLPEKVDAAFSVFFQKFATA